MEAPNGGSTLLAESSFEVYEARRARLVEETVRAGGLGRFTPLSTYTICGWEAGDVSNFLCCPIESVPCARGVRLRSEPRYLTENTSNGAKS